MWPDVTYFPIPPAAHFEHTTTKFFVVAKLTFPLVAFSPWILQNNSSILRSGPLSRRCQPLKAMPSSVRLKYVAPLLSLFCLVSAQGNNATCISLQGSTLCPNFSSASISTSLTADFPFLRYVSDVQDFDTQFATFIKTDYAKHVPQTDLEEASNLIAVRNMPKRWIVRGLI